MSTRLIENTYIQRSTLHGWGVFAKADIKEGDVIMECVIPLETFEGDTMLMKGYRFATEHGGEDVILLGHAGVINHGDGNDANCIWEINSADRLYRGVAIRDIEKDNEVLWDYFKDTQEQ